jgi:hypothetical protein
MEVVAPAMGRPKFDEAPIRGRPVNAMTLAVLECPQKGSICHWGSSTARLASVLRLEAALQTWADRSNERSAKTLFNDASLPSYCATAKTLPSLIYRCVRQSCV